MYPMLFQRVVNISIMHILPLLIALEILKLCAGA